MNVCSPKSQPRPRLHQKRHDQEVKGGDSPPLLYSCETSPGALCPALVSPTQERCVPVEASPGEGQEIDKRAGASLLQKVGAVQHGEQKALMRSYSSLPVHKEGLQEAWRGTFHENMQEKGNDINLKENRFRLDIRKQFFKGGEVMEQVSQRHCGLPIPGGLQDQAGWASE